MYEVASRIDLKPRADARCSARSHLTGRRWPANSSRNRLQHKGGRSVAHLLPGSDSLLNPASSKSLFMSQVNSTYTVAPTDGLAITFRTGENK